MGIDDLVVEREHSACNVGVEINDCMMIEDDDMLFLSSGEEFIPPFDQSVEEDDGDSQKIEGEKIPHSIGGYKTGDLLGRGGFGEVRVGEHHITNEKVALKFLRKSEIHSLNAAERTNLEIQCLMALKHNNIIRLQQVTLAILVLDISFRSLLLTAIFP